MIASLARRGRTRREEVLGRVLGAPTQLVLGLSTLLAVGGLAFANGGYFPVSWGWASSALLWVAALTLALSTQIRLGRLETALLAATAALTAWTFLSTLWTGSVTSTVLEGERMLVYLGAALVGILLLRRVTVPALLAGVWAAIALASGYGLATRLFPQRLGTFDAVAGYRLSEPLGYWNALAALAAIGTVLALGLAARSGPVLRCLAAASTVVTVLAVYFTFSRGGWISLFAGLAVAIAVDGRRLQLITTGLVLLPWPALAVALASRSDALTHQTASLSAAVRDGHGLAVITLALMVAAALAALALDALESSFRVGAGPRRAYAGALAFLLVASAIAVSGRYGLPPTLARKVYRAFNASPPQPGTNLNARLFNLSSTGRGEEWHVAWSEAKQHPWLGSGSGTYDLYWFRQRTTPSTIHDAHNLYLETLAELGPVGVLLLAAMLGGPLLAVRRARAQPLAAAAAGGLAVFALHATVDWDWEMPALTVAALFCAIALVGSAKDDRAGRALGVRLRRGALLATVAVSAFALLGLLGNAAVSASSRAAASGNIGKAESQARKARRFAPWSSTPWRKLGEAQLRAGDRAAAGSSFRRALVKDARDWTLWYELASATRGPEQRRALAHALRLNPLGTELATLQRTLEAQSG